MNNTPTPDQTEIEKQIDEILYAFANYWGRNAVDGLPRLNPKEALAAISKLMLKERIDELEGIPLDNRGDGGVWLSMSLEERNARISKLKKGI